VGSPTRGAGDANFYFNRGNTLLAMKEEALALRDLELAVSKRDSVRPRAHAAEHAAAAAAMCARGSGGCGGPCRCRCRRSTTRSA
jgi:hypothetical protein